ncbi:ATP-dependent DNA helicase [Haloechinothrix sp. LS1_15]|uniref:ATP-dependent helicase n=1 Tax=Haloechinothrix sp. LS1_15 TaxID=2652248 RepID=UPI002946E49D|nr:ATP-dependent DNA helicase [Haloechinothrix sp. LS1_15]MDV6013844.1 ATP-dependent helicase [Haloechinothrix sp. LS1_15]
MASQAVWTGQPGQAAQQAAAHRAVEVSPTEVASALGLPAPTEEQAAVIAAPPEPGLVTAGAGAGKTETMAARVVWLVASGYVTPERVLGLTFTRKAARQLAERVRARLRRLAGSGLLDRLDPSGERTAVAQAGEPTVLTYHAYAGRLISEHGLRIPIQPGARLLPETASWQLAHRVVAGWEDDLDTDAVPATVTARVLGLAGELAEHLVDRKELVACTERVLGAIENAPKGKGQREPLPNDLVTICERQRFRLQLLPLVAEYERRKRAEGALDFADQMALAARLARDHPEVAATERERYGAVLLDEYQDTGHAQRVLLRELFGGAPPLPVTAVGDPLQAIYGWRGASAANLPRFVTDFPRSQAGELVPASEYGLLTSFRNPEGVLRVANTLSGPLRGACRAGGGDSVAPLRPREGAPEADIACALVADVRAEREWVADELARRWFEGQQDGTPPTTAVLMRRRAGMAEMAAALRERGLPVEVVGLGGLLDEPEVADLVATLRVLAEPLAGSAAARLLTGARLRLGAADLAALSSRASELSADNRGQDPGEPGTLVAERAESAGLIDAVDDPGDPARYSAEGYRRIRALAADLAALRSRLDQPLAELVADVERTMRLDVEASSRLGGAGHAHLDAFAEVASEFAEHANTPTLLSFVDYLDTAERAEDGFEPGEVEVSEDRVQVLTVHAAKGLEWQVVAVPHLVQGVFPGKRMASSWLRTPTELPAEIRGDAADLPRLSLSGCADRKEVQEALACHEEEFAERHAEEERRLCYVALTRAEHALLASGYWWAETGTTPRGPSAFLTEIAEFLASARDRGEPAGSIVRWAEAPAEDEGNPFVESAREARWPVDPLGERRAAVTEGAALVRAELADLGREPEPEGGEDDDPEGWIADTDALLAERERARSATTEVALPGQLSVSRLVELAEDQGALARKLRRPLPAPPNTVARRGTTFHAWLERRFAGGTLFDFDDLPGAADTGADEDADVARLQREFEASEWAVRTPHDVEVPFVCDVDGVTLRGRMDAVFADQDGGWTVVDWKTGAVPGTEALRSAAVQLAAYRLAWAGLAGAPLEKVRAAFHYVRHNRTVRPVDLHDAEGLRDLLRSVPQR